MKRVLVIYNPVSGATNKKLLDTPTLVKRILKEFDLEYKWYETKKIKAQPFGKVFGRQKFHRVVVIGGDGTIAEVASYLVKNKKKIPLVLVPRGSANLLAGSLGISGWSRRLALRRGLQQDPRDLDAMLVNGDQCGLIATGCGYDTLLMQQTSRSLKRKLGIFAYLWTVIKTSLFYRARPYEITVDGNKHKIFSKTVMVFNVMPFGVHKINRKTVVEKVSPTDGMLNVFALNPRSLLDLFTNNPRIQAFSGKKITIKTDKERNYQIDGDVYEAGKNVDVQVRAKALSVCY
jgi:diacylglycerol kinase family enzyme